MGEFILWIIILGSIGLLFSIVYKSQKHYKWFMSLRPGDKIIVSIYSRFCECTREATVTKASDGKYIEAKVDADCSNCAEFNSKDEKGEITCWYHVTKFDKNSVGKI